jgi:uncharacterized NAD-dependent epimerase/dehydratase family protein
LVPDAALIERDESESAALPAPYLVFLGDTTEPGFAKTAFGLRDWAGDRCIGEYALAEATVSAGLTRMNPQEAVRKGARAIVIGVANPGGVIPDAWIPPIIEALDAGLDVIAGMHIRLADLAPVREVAHRHGRRLFDIRTPPASIPVGTGRKRSGRRLLTVGTDCALGKKYTALSITRGLQARGVDATFRASGQTGILIAGAGIAIDAVVADFASGAAELLSPDADPDHLDVIEGQGSLFHPSYAAVSLALLHGSQPDLFVVCHKPGREQILGHPGYTLPAIEDVIDLTMRAGRLTNPAIRCAGVSLATNELDDDTAAHVIANTSARLSLPVADPVRGGDAFERLLDACTS